MSRAPTRLAILAIDDDALVRRVLARILRVHDVLEAESGHEALAILSNGKTFNAILCDVEMAPMRGDELHALVVERFPEAAKKMIFVTGGTLSPSARAFLEAPDRIVVWKPFHSARIHEAIAEMAARG